MVDIAYANANKTNESIMTTGDRRRSMLRSAGTLSGGRDDRSVYSFLTSQQYRTYCVYMTSQ